MHPYRGADEVKTMTYTVPEDQPFGTMMLEVRGGGIVPLPYLIEKQRYNLTDEIIERLRHFKDFGQLKKEIETNDANNDLVIEPLDPGVSMINDGHQTMKKEKIKGKEPAEPSKDIIKPAKKGVVEETDGDKKSTLSTPYIVTGDGQIGIKIVSKEKRDALLAKSHQLNEGKAIIGEDPDNTDDTAAVENSGLLGKQSSANKKGSHDNKDNSSKDDRSVIFSGY